LENDLILDAEASSATGTLIERTSRLVILMHMQNRVRNELDVVAIRLNNAPRKTLRNTK